MGSSELHEPGDLLDDETVEVHRAITSIIEELDGWQVLERNRDEEKEHAAMMLELLRCRDLTFGFCLQTDLFSEGPIVVVDHEARTPRDDA